MKPLKIVLLGAGRPTFGLTSVSTLMREQEMRGSTIGLVDIDAEALKIAHELANRINAEWDAGITIVSSTDRTDLLPGADFVVCGIEVGSRASLWRIDYRIALKHGVRQSSSENGGPGGFAYAARQIPAVLDISRDIERYCPKAWLINLTEPVPRITRAVTKYTNVKTVGLCDQIDAAYALAGALLSDIIDIEVPDAILREYENESMLEYVLARVDFNKDVLKKLDIKAAGLNHFTWMLHLHDRRDGSDLYPEFKRRFGEHTVEPFSRDLLRLTGYFPIPGDAYVSEYLPYTHNPVSKPWERYGIEPPEFCVSEVEIPDVWADRTKEDVAKFARGEDSLQGVKKMPSEGVWEFIRSIAVDANYYHDAANIPNHGCLPDLPPETVVEVPVVISAKGVTGLAMGHLPPFIAELLRREAALVEAVVEAAVTGDRQVAMHALMLDPMVDDYEIAQGILEDYLETHASYLPQFHGRWNWE